MNDLNFRLKTAILQMTTGYVPYLGGKTSTITPNL